VTTRTQAPVFLSASVPDREPDKYLADPVAVREAVRSLVAVVVPERVLVFGGHPAITPLVWDAAYSLSASEFVWIYQSELYLPLVPAQARFFRNLVWTPIQPGADIKNPNDREESLKTMRKWMIEQRRLPGLRKPFDPFGAGVFIGGMDGVEKEWEMFVRTYPQARALPIASTEGAARHLWNNPSRAPPLPPATWVTLENDLNYRGLFRRLLT
jgi:hypothetical protein